MCFQKENYLVSREMVIECKSEILECRTPLRKLFSQCTRSSLQVFSVFHHAAHFYLRLGIQPCRYPKSLHFISSRVYINGHHIRYRQHSAAAERMKERERKRGDFPVKIIKCPRTIYMFLYTRKKSFVYVDVVFLGARRERESEMRSYLVSTISIYWMLSSSASL